MACAARRFAFVAWMMPRWSSMQWSSAPAKRRPQEATSTPEKIRSQGWHWEPNHDQANTQPGNQATRAKCGMRNAGCGILDCNSGFLGCKHGRKSRHCANFVTWGAATGYRGGKDRREVA